MRWDWQRRVARWSCAASSLVVLGCTDREAITLPGGGDDAADYNGYAQVAPACDNDRAEVRGPYEAYSDDDLERLTNCVRVVGELSIYGNVSRWDAVAALKRVGGLRISESSLETLSVFRSLRQVDGNVRLIGNAKLDDVSQLAALELGVPAGGAEAYVSIEENPALESLELPAKIAVNHPRTLSVSYNDTLVEVRGAPSAWRDVRVVDDPALERLELSGQIEGDLTVEGAGKLVSLDGVELERVGSLISIDNRELRTLGSHEQLVQLEAMAVIGSPELLDLGHFPNLASLDRLNLQKLPADTELDAFVANLPVRHLALTNLDATSLAQLDVHVTAGFELQTVENVASLGAITFEPELDWFIVVASGLDGVDRLPDLMAAGELRVWSNAGLDADEVLAWCAAIETQGEFTVQCSPNGDAGTSCPYTNDGVCDEPEGTGLCPEGTDFPDCGGLPLP